jgi:hypothetical protein
MIKYKYTSDWIKTLEKELHWRWYWHQQKLLENRLQKSARIAEIGVGSKFTYNYLRSKGFHVQSVDIDKNKNPDLLLNIVDCNDSDLVFDTILAFNIFEHIPYDEFMITIEKFARNNIKQLFIGLPVNKKIILEIRLRLGRYFDQEIVLAVPKRKITTANHHWELEYKKTNTNKFIHDMSERSYKCIEHFSFKLQAFFYFQLATHGK